MDDDGEDQSIEDLQREIIALRDKLQPTRRDVVVGGAMLLTGGALVYGGAGTAAADDGSESGQIGTAAEPALSVYTDTFTFHERSSVPSSPDDGTEVYIPSP